MWSYRSTSKTHSPGTKPTSDKDAAFKRALGKSRFRLGNRVKLKGTNKKGTITIVLTNVEDVKWHHNMPQFLVVNVDNEGEIMCSPVQLKGPIYE